MTELADEQENVDINSRLWTFALITIIVSVLFFVLIALIMGIVAGVVDIRDAEHRIQKRTAS